MKMELAWVDFGQTKTEKQLIPSRVDRVESKLGRRRSLDRMRKACAESLKSRDLIYAYRWNMRIGKNPVPGTVQKAQVGE